MDKKELLYLNLQDIDVFSFHLQDDLFINDNEKDVIYQYIFDKDETIIHNDDEGTRIMFRQYGDNEIYLECRSYEGNKLVIIEK